MSAELGTCGNILRVILVIINALFTVSFLGWALGNQTITLILSTTKAINTKLGSLHIIVIALKYVPS